MIAQVFDDRPCQLGEGPLWHPERKQLFWCDIVGKRLLSRVDDHPLEWQFDEMVSAAGWVDRDGLLMASETALFRLDIATGAQEHVAALEEDNYITRSNDGRADPHGGFWIGTMGKANETAAGAIYRWYRGEIRVLHDGITIPNSICFAPDGARAYFADTATHQIMTQTLDDLGWPDSEPEVFVDLRAEALLPDGSVVDSEGALWNAQWGGARVVRYLHDGRIDSIVALPGRNSSCPVFGGPGLTTLYVTTARQGMTAPDWQQGLTYRFPAGIRGQPEHRVVL